ncbi:MAG: hypothetical protein LBU08_03280 [Tannerellaceae bacterium]|jgi:hypothetical protein|nr:hypothetical protein [Tannerellaceae bacterium]
MKKVTCSFIAFAALILLPPPIYGQGGNPFPGNRVVTAAYEALEEAKSEYEQSQQDSVVAAESYFATIHDVIKSTKETTRHAADALAAAADAIEIAYSNRLDNLVFSKPYTLDGITHYITYNDIISALRDGSSILKNVGTILNVGYDATKAATYKATCNSYQYAANTITGMDNYTTYGRIIYNAYRAVANAYLAAHYAAVVNAYQSSYYAAYIASNDANNAAYYVDVDSYSYKNDYAGYIAKIAQVTPAKQAAKDAYTDSSKSHTTSTSNNDVYGVATYVIASNAYINAVQVTQDKIQALAEEQAAYNAALTQAQESDHLIISSSTSTNFKTAVYHINGLYMGNDLKTLPKGIYLIKSVNTVTKVVLH